jgi:hypothetical protein
MIYEIISVFSVQSVGAMDMPTGIPAINQEIMAHFRHQAQCTDRMASN